MASASTRFDVIVIGAGSMGAAACYHLARRGHRVLGLDQFSVPNALSSHHGLTRMIRMSYYEHPDYVPLLRRAYDLWDELADVHGHPLKFEVGGLYAGPPDGPVVGGALRAARAHGLAHQVFTPAEAAHHFPAFTLPEDFAVMYEPRAGFVMCERAVAAHATAALERGAELHGHERVVGWREERGGVVVETDRAVYHADQLILSSGAWTTRLMADLGVRLEVTRQVLGWVWPGQPAEFEVGRFPVWAIERPDGSLDYGFPIIPETPGFKLAHHGLGAPADPDRVERGPVAGDEEDFRYPLRRYLLGADGPTLAMRVCLYTNSPDGHFIIDRHPGYERVTLACGFSGHGFKFCPVVGEILADLAMERATTLPAQFLGLARFGRSWMNGMGGCRR
jgi:sarcosine oxidase